MLNALLALLDEGRAFSVGELARRLDTSEDAVKAQMEYLGQLGLLRRLHSGGCAGCGGGSCGRCGESSPRGPAMWERVSP